jgi:hypothetical protein
LVGLVVQIKWSLVENTYGGNKFKFGYWHVGFFKL